MVSQNPGSETARNILRAAEVEFATKGFEGARIDAIARRAGVNKALIYYYYPGKAVLLDSLLGEFLDQLRSVKSQVPFPDQSSGLTEYAGRLISSILAFARDRIDILRIIVMEELKGAPEANRLVSHWRAEWEHSMDSFDQKNMGPAPGDDLPVQGFFLQDMPMIVFLLLNEKWSAAMGRSPADTETLFLEQFHRSVERFYQDRR